MSCRGAFSNNVYGIWNRLGHQKRDQIRMIFHALLAFIPVSLCFFDVQGSKWEHFVNSDSDKFVFTETVSLRNNYCYFLFVFWTILISILNYKFSPRIMVIMVNLLNCVHSLTAAHLHEKFPNIYLFLQFGYATSISMCWIVVSRIMKFKNIDPNMTTGFSVLSYFYGYQATSMLDISLFCFSVYLPAFTTLNGIRLVRSLYALFSGLFQEWMIEENENDSIQNSGNNDQSESWVMLCHRWFTIGQSTAYTVFMNCVFPFCTAPIGMSREHDKLLAYAYLANALGIFANVIIVQLLMCYGYLSTRKILVGSMVLIVADYLAIWLYFEDTSMEGLFNGEKLKYTGLWLSILLKFGNAFGNSLLYTVIMAFRTQQPGKNEINLTHTVENIISNLIYGVVYHFQPHIPSLIKLILLCSSTIFLTMTYLWMEICKNNHRV